MRLCAELAEIAMQLARAAAARALTEWTEPAAEPQSEQAPNPQSEPAPDSPQPARQSAATRTTSAPYLRIPTCKPVDPALLFTRLAATVRDCIALESRLAAGGIIPRTTRAPALAPAALRDDPRRPQLRDAIAYLVKDLPDVVDLVREAARRIDEELTADPDQTITMSTLFYSLCEELDIEIDFSKLPDSSLDLLADPPNPNATPPPD